MSPQDRELVAQLCAARAGLHVDPDKSYLIESRLGSVARREGFGSLEDMMAALRQKREDRLAWGIVEAMAHAETAFFRDREPFALFRDEILPTVAGLRGGEPVRIWSAACASCERRSRSRDTSATGTSSRTELNASSCACSIRRWSTGAAAVVVRPIAGARTSPRPITGLSVPDSAS